MSKKISNQEIEAISDFIRRSVYEFKALGLSGDDIVISIPNWIKYCYRYYIRSENSFNEARAEWRLFYGIVTQPHYANEVVVFFKNNHNNHEKFTPKIHVIQFEQ